MRALVVDASVVAAAFLPEPDHDASAGVIASRRELHAPDLLAAELGNVAWKRHKRGDLTDAEAERLISDVLRLPIAYTPSTALVQAAMPLAIATGQTVNDCLYVALGVKLGTQVVTADRRLASAVAGSPLAAHVVPIDAWARSREGKRL